MSSLLHSNQESENVNRNSPVDSPGVWQPLTRPPGGPRRNSPMDVCSAREFAEIVDYERHRSVRTGEEGCLMVCRKSADVNGLRTLRLLAKIALQTVRDTDHVGWIGKDALGIILTGSPASAAERLTQQLCEPGLLSESEIGVTAL